MSDGDDVREVVRRRMVQLSIPAGADTAQLVERIAGEMDEVQRLREELEAANRMVLELRASREIWKRRAQSEPSGDWS